MNNGHYSGSREYFYSAGHSVIVVHPKGGDTSSSSLVVISATDVNNSSQSPLCQFGETLVQSSASSANSISCFSPSTGDAAHVQVRIADNAYDLSYCSDIFRFYPSARVASLLPVRSPVI